MVEPWLTSPTLCPNPLPLIFSFKLKKKKKRKIFFEITVNLRAVGSFHFLNSCTPCCHRSQFTVLITCPFLCCQNASHPPSYFILIHHSNLKTSSGKLFNPLSGPRFWLLSFIAPRDRIIWTMPFFLISCKLSKNWVLVCSVSLAWWHQVWRPNKYLPNECQPVLVNKQMNYIKNKYAPITPEDWRKF